MDESLQSIQRRESELPEDLQKQLVEKARAGEISTQALTIAEKLKGQEWGQDAQYRRIETLIQDAEGVSAREAYALIGGALVGATRSLEEKLSSIQDPQRKLLAEAHIRSLKAMGGEIQRFALSNDANEFKVAIYGAPGNEMNAEGEMWDDGDIEGTPSIFNRGEYISGEPNTTNPVMIALGETLLSQYDKPSVHIKELQLSTFLTNVLDAFPPEMSQLVEADIETKSMLNYMAETFPKFLAQSK